MARKSTKAKASPKTAKRKPSPTRNEAAPVDSVADALTHAAAERKADEATLRADPVFRAAAEHGQRWTQAQRAAAEAAAPFRAELDKLTAAHPHGYGPESDEAERFDALRLAIRDAEAREYAKHGFTRSVPPTSPAELLARLNSIELNWWFDLQETMSLSRPTELLWQDADRLRKRNPFLPVLPTKPDDGRERYVVLVRWCKESVAANERGDDRNGEFAQRSVSEDKWVEPIDEYDESLLEFLNRKPILRRKISDVLPDKGPQDRKAVANRLRKLADRTPPLVDYPKDERSGVAIFPAGIALLSALKPH